MGLLVITDTVYTRAVRPLIEVDSCCFYAVYRLVDGWQEIREYQQLMLKMEPFFTTKDDVQPEEDGGKKHKLQGEYATMR